MDEHLLKDLRILRSWERGNSGVLFGNVSRFAATVYLTSLALNHYGGEGWWGGEAQHSFASQNRDSFFFIHSQAIFEYGSNLYILQNIKKKTANSNSKR